jgi:hypothetical protein
MPYALFHSLFPEVAERETRSVTVGFSNRFKLPRGQYGFLEMFCDEPQCDCRRVLFFVVSSRHEDPLAVLAWGWEEKEFYVKWLGENDPLVIDELKGPALNLASPQTDLAPHLLRLLQEVLLQDTAYVERIKRHYAMFRERIDGNQKAGVKRNKRGKRRKKKI